MAPPPVIYGEKFLSIIQKKLDLAKMVGLKMVKYCGISQKMADVAE